MVHAHFLFAAVAVAVLCNAPDHALAQVSMTQSTAGVPLSQNVGNGQTMVTYPSSQGGTSTGTSVVFQSGSGSAVPTNVVASTTLTGAAASEASASLSSNAAQESGSMGAGLTTTGGAIAGISTGLTGGFTAPTAAAGSSSSMSMASQSNATGSKDGQMSTFASIDKAVCLASAAFAMLLGSLIVL